MSTHLLTPLMGLALLGIYLASASYLLTDRNPW